MAALADQPTFTIDMEKALGAVADRPNSLWQDVLFQTQAVKERRKLRKYKLSTANASASWSAPGNIGGNSSNGTAYLHANTSFGIQNPQAGEVVYTVRDDGTIRRFDPANDGAVIAPDWTTATGLGNVVRSSIMLSSNNHYLFLLTTTGYFMVLNASTGVRLAAVRLSTSGFTGVAPFIDYSAGGLTSQDPERLFALANDGSLYRCVITATGIQVSGWRSRNGGANGTDLAALGTGVTNITGTLPITVGTITNVDMPGVPMSATLAQASPIVWNGVAYYGTRNGRLVRIRTAANAADSIIVSTREIVTTPAVEWNAAFTAIQDVFVPAGDRLHWIDASNPTSLTRTAISPPLVLDKKPTSLTADTCGRLADYTYATSTNLGPYNVADYTATTNANVPAAAGPTRWGDGTVELASVNLPQAPWGIAYNQPNDSIWVTTPSNSKANSRVVQIDASSPAAGASYDGKGNYAALVVTTNVGAGSDPCHATGDPHGGGVWVACYGTNQLRQLDASGAIVRTINNVPRPAALYYQNVGNDGNAANDFLWVASCNLTGTNPPVGGALLKIPVPGAANSNYTQTPGTTYFDKAHATYAGGNRLKLVGDTGQNTNETVNVGSDTSSSNIANAAGWTIAGPQGIGMDAFGRIWMSNSLERMSQNHCDHCPTLGLTMGFPFNLDGRGMTNDSGQAATTDRSSVLIFDPATNLFRAVLRTAGAPFNIERFGNSMWLPTYRYFIDTVARYNVTGTYAGLDFKKLYESGRNTGDHWQPHWVAVDTNIAPARVYTVNGNANTAYVGTANVGMDCLRADADNRGLNPATNANGFMHTDNPRYIRQPGKPNGSAAGFTTGAQPRGVAVTSDSHVWVSNSSAQTCVKYDKDGNDKGTFPVGDIPWCVAVDKFDVAWVCNRGSGTISRLPASIKPPAELDRPRGISIDKNQNMWIANYNEPKMTVMDQTGNIVYTNATVSVGTNTQGVAAGTTSGNVLVAANGQDTAVIFNGPASPADPTGTVLAPGGTGNWAAAVRPNGYGFVTGHGNRYIRRVRADGSTADGRLDTGANSYPRGIDIDPANDGFAWAALNYNGNNGQGRLVRFPTTAAGAVDTTVTVGNGPNGVAVRGNQVWVATGAPSVTRVNARTGGGRAAVGTVLENITGYTDAANSMDLALDSYGNAWVTNNGSTRVNKLWRAGDQDLMAASNYGDADGIASHMFFRFAIANDGFAGRTPLAANLLLKPITTSAMNTETVRAWTASTTVPSTSQLWTGWNGTNTVQWNARPSISDPLGQFAGALTSATAAISVPVGIIGQISLNNIVDFPNTPYDAANGQMAFAVQSVGAGLADVAHYERAGGDRPRLRVTTTTTALAAGTGIRSQPTIDSGNQRIYVLTSNAVFELRYTSAADFADPTKIAYSYTKNGLSTGIGTLNGTTYITPTGSSFLTETGRLACIDFNGTNSGALSCFNVGWTPQGNGFMLVTNGNNSTQLVRTYVIPNAPGTFTNAQAVYDYDQGSVYIANGDRLNVMRILQP